MTIMLTFVLLLFAFICFVLAAFWLQGPGPAPGGPYRPSLVPLGLALWVLVPLIAAWPGK